MARFSRRTARRASTALLGGAHVGAFVALSTEVDDVDPKNASLARFLEALRPLRESARQKPDDERMVR